MKAATFDYPRAHTVGEAAGLTLELDEDECLTEYARRQRVETRTHRAIREALEGLLTPTPCIQEAR